ncbi:MAG: hypothetical protein HQK49_02225 [Oligoflexia bacterium]|nr:hypothetical protein [Oligoflexia bacterium]
MLDEKKSFGPIGPIIVITGEGGGGHKAASNAVIDALKDVYGKENIYEMEPLHNRMCGMEKLYNRFCELEWWNILKGFTAFQRPYDYFLSWYNGERIAERIKKISSPSPSMIITVHPFATKAYQLLAIELKIPLVIIPTDFDPVMCLGVDNNREKMKDVYIFLPLSQNQNEDIYKIVCNTKIGFREENVRFVGYPVRSAIERIAITKTLQNSNGDVKLQQKLEQELQQLKDNYGIQERDKTIFISIGAEGWGRDAIFDYIKIINDNIEMLSQRNKYHIIVATGKNKKLADELKLIEEEILNKNVRVCVHIEGWLTAEEYAKRLLISIPILKPGGSATGEVIALQKPVILKSDSSDGLRWERYNLKILKKLQLGYPLLPMKNRKVDAKNFIEVLQQYETDNNLKDNHTLKLKANFKQNILFSECLQKEIKNILEKKLNQKNIA